MNRSPLYPIFLDLHEQPVLVVGAGPVALRKVRSLLEAGAAVTVVSPEFGSQFTPLPQVTPVTAPYHSTMMKEQPWRLVFAATHDPAINAQVHEDAAVARILCCRADEGDESDFANAATARIGPVTLAVSTHGASPTLARRIRDAAQNAVDPTLVTLAELSAQWRDTVKNNVNDLPARAALLQKLAGPEMEKTLRTSGKPAAEALFANWLAQAHAPSAAGEGDHA